MNFFKRNLSMHFKKYHNFQTENKLKELVLVNYYAIPEILHVI